MNYTFVGDFETTVFKNQTYTEVWASALIELNANSSECMVFSSLDDTYKFLTKLNGNCIIYYHNLKFDGTFWLDFLLKKGYQNAIDENSKDFKKVKDMKNNEIRYNISLMGQWYSITFKHKNHTFELRDSLKLLPFPVRKLSKSFNTSVKKLEIEYEGERHANGYISKEEEKYIANDVIIVKEALEQMFSRGFTKITIGSNCLAMYKQMIGKDVYRMAFPNLYDMPLDKELFGYSSVGEYLRRSYHGGYCYVKKGCENKEYGNGLTYDVNSLYSSVMHSKSGNYFPIGVPTFWKGSIPEECLDERRHLYYFLTVKCRFELKEGFLPTIQIKNNSLYKSTEWLETSDIKMDGEYARYSIDKEGNKKEVTVTMVMTCTDYKLFHEHYNVYNEEIIGGCWFRTQIGIFDQYIDHFMKMKIEATDIVMRTIAKLFLNNLYGQMAKNTDSSCKVMEIEDDKLSNEPMISNNKVPGFIAVGSAITSYARNFTIRHAQMNYNQFIYADTDSIHCWGSKDTIIGIVEHPKNMLCWKNEANWDRAIFARQKTYIEHIVEEDCKKIEEPYYNIKCAGMNEKCKMLLNRSLQGKKYNPKDKEDVKLNLTEEQIAFMNKKRDLKDFKKGLVISGKLLPHIISGGTVLIETTFEMR